VDNYYDLNLRTFDLFINQTFLFLDQLNLNSFTLLMDLLLIFIGFLLVLLGLIGSFVPIIPGPFSAWLGLLILHQTSFLAPNFSFLILTFSIAIGVFILDYFIPILGAKKFGGTKAGILGATLGLLIGLLFLGPLGIFLGTFIGAFIGELIRDSSDKNTALRAATGSLIGFLTGVFLKFSVTVTYAYYFVKIILRNPLLL
jgi:hypothetical protein